MKILGIDIGGSALKGAPVDTKTGELLAEKHRIDTPTRLAPQEMGAAIARLAAHFAWKGPIGVGFPGVVQGPVIRTSANLHPDFVGLDAVAVFEKACGAQVSLVNDADAAGLAEATYGAGRGVKGAVLLLTFGTGVGSALFVDGLLYPNSEFGHLKRDGESWEKFVSGAAKERRGLDYPTWAADVGIYLRELENLLWPDLIIAGGGISAEHAKWFPHLGIRSRIVPAEFRNEAGIVGAALHAARTL
jgi:polyphosphate glucokinase